MCRKKIIKYLSVSVCAITILSTLAGCGSKNNAAQGGKETASSGAPTTISIITPFYQPQPPKKDDNPIQKKIESTTNTKLDIEYVPSGNTYKDKLNVMIASNKLPMVTITDAGIMRSSSITNSAMNGMFWEIGGLLKDYPNLSKFYNNQLVINNTLIDGKLYGLPMPRVLGRVGIVYRKDWLDNLGMKAPTNTEEFYQLAKAFVEKDPDKNGKADTVGFEYADISTGSYGWNGISTFTVANGGFNEWGLQDGKMIPDFMTNEYMDTLKLLKKMYQEKLMNQDFALVTGSKRYDAVEKGNVGMFPATVDDAIMEQQKTAKIVPTAKFEIAPVFTGPKGQKLPSTVGHNGAIMFSKTSIKTEAELKNVLKFYDRMVQQDMLDLLTYGVEGTDYKTENGKRTFTDEANFIINNSDMTKFLPRPAVVEKDTQQPIEKSVNDYFKASEKLVVSNPTAAYNSDTRNEKGGELDKAIFDARVKFVMGEIDEAGFKKAVETWQKNGGDQVIKEYTDQYNKLSKK